MQHESAPETPERRPASPPADRQRPDRLLL